MLDQALGDDRRHDLVGFVDGAARTLAWRERERVGKVFGETIAAIEWGDMPHCGARWIWGWRLAISKPSSADSTREDISGDRPPKVFLTIAAAFAGLIVTVSVKLVGR